MEVVASFPGLCLAFVANEMRGRNDKQTELFLHFISKKFNRHGFHVTLMDKASRNGGM